MKKFGSFVFSLLCCFLLSARGSAAAVEEKEFYAQGMEHFREVINTPEFRRGCHWIDEILVPKLKRLAITVEDMKEAHKQLFEGSAFAEGAVGEFRSDYIFVYYCRNFFIKALDDNEEEIFDNLEKRYKDRLGENDELLFSLDFHLSEQLSPDEISVIKKICYFPEYREYEAIPKKGEALVEKITGKMQEFVERLQGKMRDGENFINIAAFAHQRILDIKPFDCQNRLFAVALMNVILKIGEQNYPEMEFKEYCHAIDETQMGIDNEAFIKFLIKNINPQVG